MVVLISTPSFLNHPIFITGFKTTKYPYKIKFKPKPNSILPFSSNFPLSHSKKIRFLARLSRPTNRKNSLREKLTQHQPSQLNEVNSNPPAHFDNIDVNYSSFDKNSVEENRFDDTSCKASEEIDGSDGNVLKTESLGSSDFRSKLETWADQYKADYEFWGIGFNPIFTVFQNKEGKIERVVVNEDEILKRNGIELEAYRRNESNPDFVEVSSKIFHAKFLASKMESGNYEIPKSSSLAKVVDLGKTPGFVESIQGFSVPPNFQTKTLSSIGMVVLCGFFSIWAIKGLFVGGDDKEEYTSLEKEMMRRKIKSRKERENLVKGSVEVINDPLETKLDSVERPSLDKEELLSSIMKAKPIGERVLLQESLNSEGEKSDELDAKIMEIREMARRAREIERENSSSGDSDERGEFNYNNMPSTLEDVPEGEESGLSDHHSAQMKDSKKILMPFFFSNDLENEYVMSEEEPLVDNNDTQTPNSKTSALKSGENTVKDVMTPEKSIREDPLKNVDKAFVQISDTLGFCSGENIVENVVDPRERDRQDPIKNINMGSTAEISDTKDANSSLDPLNGEPIKAMRGLGKKPSVITSVKEAKEFLSMKNEKREPEGKITSECGDNVISKGEKKANFNTKHGLEIRNGLTDNTISGKRNTGPETIKSEKTENWMENNFQTLEPLMKKIGGGFRENYAVARDKIKQELDTNSSMDFPDFDNDDDELEWMKDDKLREIVFQVRDNELTGRDPFCLMDEKDKLAFFEGLEKKAEKESEKLSKLHEYLHSNIENLDYGADGISVYDLPEKIIPRWKGPPINQKQNKNPQFLENFVEQRRTLVNGTKHKEIKNESRLNALGEVRESPSFLSKSDLNNPNKKSPKTVIEGSDGSSRAGKKSGKEFWEHTKKWSQGFLDSYNAETDPEIKAVMKDMGKDLDRWITPKEIQEAADIMDELPGKKKEFVEKKLSKVRREMELFGPQAVLSKYKEYGEQKKEDYLWWLDLPFVLCIELYTSDNGEQRIGLYSLEMAEDLELDPKPIHVIAFENPSDCKNLCYIINGHMKMLGNGNAFVVARPPKDAFREAKANGFSVTVIKKRELQLHVDQTLEEVEEQITEIGTKLYHDKIIGEQSVDMSTLMKGVFGAKKPSRRRSSRGKLKRPTK